jgi:DNA polymerase-3 subunit epsilon
MINVNKNLLVIDPYSFYHQGLQKIRNGNTSELDHDFLESRNINFKNLWVLTLEELLSGIIINSIEKKEHEWENEWDIFLPDNNIDNIIIMPKHNDIIVDSIKFHIIKIEAPIYSMFFDEVDDNIKNYESIVILGDDNLLDYTVRKIIELRGYRPKNVILLRKGNHDTTLSSSQGSMYWQDWKFVIMKAYEKSFLKKKEASTKAKGHYLVVDIETTGLPKDFNIDVNEINSLPRIVQIAWHFYDIDENLVESRNYIIKPDNFTIPFDSEKIHGISTARAFIEGETLSFALARFFETINHSLYLIGHNLEFIEKVIESECIRNKIAFYSQPITKVCTMKGSVNYCKIPGKSGFNFPSLSELYKTIFGIDYRQTHDAQNDAKDCAQCFFFLKREKKL